MSERLRVVLEDAEYSEIRAAARPQPSSLTPISRVRVGDEHRKKRADEVLAELLPDGDSLPVAATRRFY